MIRQLTLCVIVMSFSPSLNEIYCNAKEPGCANDCKSLLMLAEC